MTALRTGLYFAATMLLIGAAVRMAWNESAPVPDAQRAHAAHAAHSAEHGTHVAENSAHAAHEAAAQRTGYTVAARHYAVPSVELVDQTGAHVALTELLAATQPIALNFIFTTCTTICPVMTATFAQAQHELGDAAADVRWVSISVDPDYDRPAVLKAYADQFDARPEWLFLTGDSADVTKALMSFDAYTGSKMNHRAVTLLKGQDDSSWVRIEGLASGSDLAREISAALLD